MQALRHPIPLFHIAMTYLLPLRYSRDGAIDPILPSNRRGEENRGPNETDLRRGIFRPARSSSTHLQIALEVDSAMKMAGKAKNWWHEHWRPNHDKEEQVLA